MTRDRLRRIHAVTDNFFFWQGLRFVPLGAALVGISIVQSSADHLRQTVRPLLGISFLVAALWISFSVIGPYYDRTFGRVKMDLERHGLRTTVKWLIVYPALIAAVVVDMRLHPPIILSAIAFGLAIEAYRESTGGGRLHYVAASVTLGALALLPMSDVMSPGLAGIRIVVFVLGAVYIIGGVLDHRELLRILGSASETGSVGAI